MLCLSRHANESIQIGNDVTVTVLEITGNKVTLGIDAPRSVTVHRHEVLERIAQDKVLRQTREGQR
jgi:carbon storage regulator